MKTLLKATSVAAAGLAAAALTALPAAAASAATGTAAHASGSGVVFVQNDSVSGNTITAYDRNATGALTQAGSYPTGGLGGALGGSVADHLASQGSLAYDAGSGLLYAVNAGSDTITTFAVKGDRLEQRQTLSSGGDFPVSIAVDGNLVFVLNARDGGSISGYLQAGGRVRRVTKWHRDLGLAAVAPGASNEFTSTPGQVGFTPSGDQLLVTTKNGGNSVLAYRVSPNGPSRTPVTTSLPGTVPFGFTFDAHGNLALTEAGPSAVVSFRVARSGSLTQLDDSATGQAATCWITRVGHTLYTSNAGSADVSIYASGASGVLTDEGTASTDLGTVDATGSSDGHYLYVQAGRAGTVDSFAVASDGSLTSTGSVTVPDGLGAEGIVAL